MIDFTLSDAQIALQQQIRQFVADKIIPYEKDPRNTAHGPTDELRVELNALAKAEGIFTPHVPSEWGGMGLNHVDCAIAFEAADNRPIRLRFETLTKEHAYFTKIT